MKKYLLLITVSVLGMMCTSSSMQAQEKVTPSLAVDDVRCAAWVDSVMSRLSLQEKIGQLLVPRVPAVADKATRKRLKEWVRKYKIGGLLFAQGTLEGQAALTNQAQKEAKVPLLMTVDGEWGLAMRLKDAPGYPRNAALGCIADVSLLEAYGREVARQLRALGVQVNFAPVADANTNPLNPVINTRSFGEDPGEVARRVVAYSRGLESGGVLSVAKHFPGHGDTDTDSHKALPVLRHDRARLDSVELLPFRDYIRAGLGGMMIGHLQVPALEEDSLLPSSLSRAIVTDLLQEEMGFQGLIFTDALDMKGVTRVSGFYVKAIQAGNDMLLVQYAPGEALHEVMHAVRQGTLSEADVDARCRRVLAWKYRLGLRQKPDKISLKEVKERICTPQAEEMASALRRASVTVLNNYFGVLPLAPAPDGRGIALLSLGAQEADSAFVSSMQRHGGVETFRLPLNATREEQLALQKELASYGRVVVSIAGVNYVGESNVAFLAGLNLRAPLVYVFFTPYRLLPILTPALAKANAVVLAHSAEEDLQRHVARVLFAEEGANGRLSMSAGRLFPAGDGVDICPGMAPASVLPDDWGMKSYVLEGINRIARRGLEAGAYPGCRILIWKDGQPVYDQGFGTHSDKDTTSVRPTDLFDLASLTKTTATLLAVMKLYDEGRLKLDDKVSTYLAFLRRTDKRNITIRQLLLHESGLLPYIRFYMEAIDPHSVHGPYAQSWEDEWHRTRVSEHSYYCSDFKFKKGLMSGQQTHKHTLHVADGMWLDKAFKKTILNAIARSALEGKRYVYSDLGFILLQQIVEHITCQPLNVYVSENFYTPMGLTRTTFNPLEKFPKSEIMPTASNDFLRRQDLCGYVHDEAAAFLGGVAGHAGLFSTASEVASIYQMLLDGGVWQGKRYLSEETCRLFTTEKSLISRRGLGFDRPDVAIVKRSPCAPSAPEGVYGHTGFTGTCAWVDPASRTVYVFLSNRVCPNVWNTKLGDMDIRTDIQELIFKSLYQADKENL